MVKYLYGKGGTLSKCTSVCHDPVVMLESETELFFVCVACFCSLYVCDVQLDCDCLVCVCAIQQFDWSILHGAASCGRLAVVKWLLSKKADNKEGMDVCKPTAVVCSCVCYGHDRAYVSV